MTPPRIPRASPPHRRKPKTGIRMTHRAFIKSLSCVGCGAPPPCDPAHVRTSRADVGKFNAMSAKPDDKYLVGLCRSCHDRQHTKEGESTFWANLGIDPVDLSLRLYSVTGDMEAGNRAVFRARQAIELHRR